MEILEVNQSKEAVQKKKKQQQQKKRVKLQMKGEVIKEPRGAHDLGVIKRINTKKRENTEKKTLVDVNLDTKEYTSTNVVYTDEYKYIIPTEDTKKECPYLCVAQRICTIKLGLPFNKDRKVDKRCLTYEHLKCDSYNTQTSLNSGLLSAKRMVKYEDARFSIGERIYVPSPDRPILCVRGCPFRRTCEVRKKESLRGYRLRCKRCGKYFFSTSLREAKKELKEHWDKKHWNWLADFDENEYSVDKLTGEAWRVIQKRIGTPEFNRELYHS